MEEQKASLEEIHFHLSTIQSIVDRLASNSANAKSWAVALVSGITAFLVESEELKSFFIGLIPLLSLCYIDSYYLALERKFRKIYTRAVKAYQEGQLSKEFLYHLEPERVFLRDVICAAKSHSVWPFYFLVILVPVLFYILSNLGSRPHGSTP